MQPHLESKLEQLRRRLEKLEKNFQKEHADIQKEIHELQKPQKHIDIPIEAFSTNLTPLETIVYALKQKHNLSTKAISEKIKRSASSVSNTLRNAHSKQQEIPWPKDTVTTVKLTEFDSILSPAEAVILELHKIGIRTAHIARLINRDSRNINSTLHRAKNKRGEQNE